MFSERVKEILKDKSFKEQTIKHNKKIINKISLKTMMDEYESTYKKLV
jgi:hypothetical protein